MARAEAQAQAAFMARAAAQILILRTVKGVLSAVWPGSSIAAGGYQTNPKQLSGGQYHVFTTTLCKRDQKLHKRAVNAVEPAVPRYLRWSEQPIVWSREDHPPRVDNPDHLALVVAPQVGGYKFTKVLMDGGSSINILYYETFRRMGLIDKNLSQSNTIFHGVVPGKSAYPVGKIELEVAFGDENNYRVEKLTFEVVKIRSPYHAIFGRPAYAKLMAKAVLCLFAAQDAGS